MWTKKIHQTYECDFGELHESFKSCCNSWKSAYPDWEYNFRNSKERREDVINILEFSLIEAEIYDNYSGVIQSDIWRYAVTGFHGGMYADLDSKPVSNIEPILYRLSDGIELVALPSGFQRGGKPGSNNSNFILKAGSQIALSLLSDIKEHFTANEKRINSKLKPILINSNKFFVNTTIFHEAKVAQIFDSEYVVHSKGLKPDDEYRNTQEKLTNYNYFGFDSSLL